MSPFEQVIARLTFDVTTQTYTGTIAGQHFTIKLEGDLWGCTMVNTVTGHIVDTMGTTPADSLTVGLITYHEV